MKFHLHKWKLIRWRLVHHPEHEPSRIVMREKCSVCGKERNKFSKEYRDLDWEKEYQKLEGFWFGNEKYLEVD